MKILSVCISLPNESAAWWRISNIAKLLQNNGHEVEFVFYVSKNTFRKIDSNKIKIPFKYSIIQVNFINIHFKHLIFILKKRYDLVYSNLQSAAFCSILTKFTGIPMVFDMHGDVGNLEEFLEYDLNTKEKSITNLLKYVINRIVDYSSIKFSDKIICVSKKNDNVFRRKRHI
ncbi:glycosyltransferase [Methanobacterium sp. SMA-27]|uniref:glycosyltransferase n=1 Tax=Methanobacterium sp. SMA-27 TaxID=1495336 RepID=UPI00064F1FB2|nr:glycosyltransferase [Methanobacterium sp. SMA-27]